MSSAVDRLQPLLSRLSSLQSSAQTTISQHRALTTTILSTSVLLALLIPPARRDYSIYLSLGAGGLPSNIRGWLITNILRLFGRETKSTTEYDASPDTCTFLSSPLIQRSGARATTAPHPVPHRQIDQFPSEAAKASLLSEFDKLAQEEVAKGTVQIKLSGMEMHTDALFVAEGVSMHDAARQTKGEIAHVHGRGEGSLHVVLAPRDAKEVIEKGWGERHPLSGVGSLAKLGLRGRQLPNTYLFLYAPRDEEEVRTVLGIVRAAVGYMTAGES